MNNYGITLQYIRNIYLRDNFNFYFGGGPNFNYGYTRNVSNAIGSGIAINSELKKYYGINAITGIEWYFTKNMSLSAEYGIKYLYSEDIINQSAINNDNIIVGAARDKVTENQFMPNNVLFGLTIYF